MAQRNPDMPKPTSFAQFLSKAGLPSVAAQVIKRKFRFFNDQNEGYELGGIIERYEIYGDTSIYLYINRPDCHLVFSAVAPPRGDGVFQWKLVDTARGQHRITSGAIELL